MQTGVSNQTDNVNGSSFAEAAFLSFDGKPWWQSKTILGILGIFAAQLLRKIGVVIAPDDPAIMDLLANLVSAGMGVFAIYGRKAATQPIGSGSVQGKTGLLIFAAFFIGALMNGCATNTADQAANARGRATNAALLEAGGVLERMAATTLLNVAQQEMGGNGAKIDLASAASAGLWANMGNIVSSGAVEHVITAYSGGALPRTAAVAADVFASGVGSDAQVTNAIATVISTAAGAPPAK